MIFPAPSRGWVQSGNITKARPDQAEVLENFIPTAQGAKMRGGAAEHVDIAEQVDRLMVLSASTDTLYAASATGVYDCNRIASGGSVFPDIAALTSGDWSATQTSTSAGDYMVMVNGSDPMMATDGSGFFPVVSAAITNLPYDTLTAMFQVGQTVTGGTSGATSTIRAVIQTSATTGILRVSGVTGVYVDNEAITGPVGSALVNGSTSAGSSITVTNVTTSDLIQVWLFKLRLFFIEKNSLSAWYLPAGAIGGAAVELPLGAVFRRGGRLLFGATWSLDSGSGLDDVCLFVTTNGEIAVYEGTDPSSSSTWSLTGVYDIAKPLNKHGWFKAGGDMAILTEDGIIPVSEALRKDRAALQAAAITAPIEDAWKSIVTNATTAFPITPTLWQDQGILMVGTAGSIVIAANAKTGAWAKLTGWDFRCGAVANGNVYFGTTEGKVALAFSTGTDFGLAYNAKYVPKFQSGPSFMSANMGLVTLRAPDVPQFAMAAFSDYKIGTYPTAQPVGVESGETWGGGAEWGDGSVWGSLNNDITTSIWKMIRASGYAIAPVLVVQSNQATPPNVEILGTKIRYEIGTGI